MHFTTQILQINRPNSYFDRGQSIIVPGAFFWLNCLQFSISLFKQKKSIIIKEYFIHVI